MAATEVTWTTHRLAGRRGAKAFLLALGAIVAVVAWRASGSVALATVAVGLVAAAVAPALLPTTYTLGEDGVAVRRLRRTTTHPWSAFARIAVDGELVVLSPYAKPSLRDLFRGRCLRFGGASAEVREAAVRFALARLAGRSPG
jgi:hypothetical protein